MNHEIPYRIFPSGDASITLDFGNTINETINKEVIAKFKQLQIHPLPFMIEAVPAYSSLTVYYNVVAIKKKITGGLTAFEWIRQQLEERWQQPVPDQVTTTRLVNIPVCYEKEFALDAEKLTRIKNISIDEMIRIHSASSYRVYMLGFLPGFAYMGEVDEKIAMPRKKQPQPIEAGSVGIAGRQTGIYPMASPGGWQIIGRTPLQLFDPEREEPTLLKAGDTVRFYSISKDEFNNY